MTDENAQFAIDDTKTVDENVAYFCQTLAALDPQLGPALVTQFSNVESFAQDNFAMILNHLAANTIMPAGGHNADEAS